MKNNYHAKTKDEVIKEFESDIKGSSSVEAGKRLAANGLNELPKVKKDSLLKIFLEGGVDHDLKKFMVYWNRKDRLANKCHKVLERDDSWCSVAYSPV